MISNGSCENSCKSLRRLAIRVFKYSNNTNKYSIKVPIPKQK